MPRTKKVAESTGVTEVAVVKPRVVKAVKVKDESASVEQFISQAIANNVPVETMERLLAMRKELKAEQAREAYIAAMAKFQAECPIIEKKKEVNNNDRIVYKYAPIESIVSQVKDPLKDNGFSYSTNMKLSNNEVTASVKVQHIKGHSEVTDMTVPLGSKTAVMSDSQVVAAASTFAKRYAFLNAFGILTGDEDNDGQEVPPKGSTPPPVAPGKLDAKNPVFTAARKRIEACRTLEELGKVWADLNIHEKTALNEIKEEMKAIFTSEGQTIS